MISQSNRTFFLACFCSCILQLASGSTTAALSENDSVAVGLISEHRLVLPKSYQTYLPALRQAAHLAVQSPRCREFLQGSLHVDRSTPGHPVFRILCRGEGGSSFAMLVDGISLHLLDDTRPGGSISFPELRREFDAGPKAVVDLSASEINKEAGGSN